MQVWLDQKDNIKIVKINKRGNEDLYPHFMM